MDEALRAAQRSTAAAVASAATQATASSSEPAAQRKSQELVERTGVDDGVRKLLESWVQDTLTGTSTSGLSSSTTVNTITGTGAASTRSYRASTSNLANPKPQPEVAATKKRLPPSASREEASGEDKEGEASGSAPDSKAKDAKRAAQNRAAQKAFRERRDSYIKELEERMLHFEPALRYAHAASSSLSAYESHSSTLFSAAVQLRDQLRAAGLEPVVEPSAPPNGPSPALPPRVAALAKQAAERSAAEASEESEARSPAKRQRKR